MTRFQSLTFLSVCLMASVVQAETLRDRSLHVTPYAVLAAGQTADVWSTTRNFSRGCTEANRGVFGSAQPSVGRLVAVKALGMLPSVVVTALLQKAGHQKAANVVGAIGGAVGFGAAGFNLSVDCRR